ncbi:MAG TPA: vanadium-dependent haloperoxidase, partial [Acidimicrobiia bacterium]|nr:vanadium-dependent haloperoxidase [Acidimicrobiia bacterium]
AAGEGDLRPLDPGPPRAGTVPRQVEIDEMVELSAGLTDEQKVIAEYWADGAGSELPPGHWMRFGEFCSRRDALGVDSDVKLFFLLANAMLDASIAAWDRKVRFDSIRPISLVRHTYAGRTIRAWGGPHQGPRDIDGAAWKPYLPTPPFAEYPSGHSTFSAAGAGVLNLFTGRGDFGATVVVPAGASHVEPGAVPAKEVVLHWPTFDDAADQAAFSRRLGGIHFASGDVGGRLVGRRVAARVVARGRDLFAGRAG